MVDSGVCVCVRERVGKDGRAGVSYIPKSGYSNIPFTYLNIGHSASTFLLPSWVSASATDSKESQPMKAISI